MNRISCIIPAYNCERFIERSLDSVLSQSRPPDELIIVDDGSTDRTPEILSRYATSLSIIRQENSGPAAARNRGIEAASGDLICFQDADDEWLPNKLAAQLACLESHPDSGLCITHIRNIWCAGMEDEREQFKDHPMANDPPGYVFQTLLARRRAFDRVGMLNESLVLAEDVEWYARAKDMGIGLEVVPEVLVRRYLHGDNMTAQRKTTASEMHEDLLNLIAARVKGTGTQQL